MAKKTPSKEPKEEPQSFLNHMLVPKHELCTEEEKKQILVKYNVKPNQLPRIRATDPAIRHLGVKQGDVIKITRSSETAGEATFYRIIANE